VRQVLSPLNHKSTYHNSKNNSKLIIPFLASNCFPSKIIAIQFFRRGYFVTRPLCILPLVYAAVTLTLTGQREEYQLDYPGIPLHPEPAWIIHHQE